MDYTRLGGGAPHVEGDGIGQSERSAERLRPDHAGRGTGFQHAHALFLRLLRLVQAASRLYQEERSGKTALLKVRIDAGDVAADARPDEGVRDNRRATFELPILLR